MNLNNKTKMLSVGVVGLLAMSMLGIGMVQADDMVFEHPTGYLYVDADVDFDTSSLAHPDYRIIKETSYTADDFLSMEIGDTLPIEIKGIHSVTRVSEDSWKSRQYLILDAPVIDVNELMRQNQRNGLGLSVDDIPNTADEFASYRVNSGQLDLYYGDVDYLVENDTHFSVAEFDIEDNFAVSSYPVLYLEGYRGYNGQNVTVKVSYAATSSPADLTEANVFNQTIYDKTISNNDDVFFRLDLEATNTSYDDYVANIEIGNISIAPSGGHYILDTESSVFDARYIDWFTTDLDTAEYDALRSSNAYLPIIHHKRWDGRSQSAVEYETNNGLELSLFNDFSFSDFVGDVTGPLTGSSTTSPTAEEDGGFLAKAFGWLSESDLDDALKLGFAQNEGVDKNKDGTIDEDDVDSFDGLGAIFSSIFGAETMNNFQTLANQQFNLDGDLNSMMDSLMPDSFPSFGLFGDGGNIFGDIGSGIGGIFSGLGQGVDFAANGLGSLGGSLLNGVTSFGGNVTDWVFGPDGAVRGTAAAINTVNPLSGLGDGIPWTLIAILGIVVAVIIFIAVARKAVMGFYPDLDFDTKVHESNFNAIKNKIESSFHERSKLFQFLRKE